MEEQKQTQEILDLESKDYDVTAVKDLDERMEAGKKDAIFFHTLGVVCTIAATIWMYAFGTADPAQMRYFLGMPLWISGAVIIYLLMFAAGMIYLLNWEEFPLTARWHRITKQKKGGKSV